jgi:hypothetical protein
MSPHLAIVARRPPAQSPAHLPEEQDEDDPLAPARGTVWVLAFQVVLFLVVLCFYWWAR